MLPDGLHFRIWDAWRPFALQLELYQKYSQDIIARYNLENKSEEEKTKEIQKFVSYPQENRMIPPVHTTGGAVDLMLIDEAAHEHLNGIYDITMNSEWVYPISGLVFNVNKK